MVLFEKNNGKWAITTYNYNKDLKEKQWATVVFK